MPTEPPTASAAESPRGWTVLVPVKRLDGAKTRLSSRPAPTRRALALAFAVDTVRAATACEEVEEVLVVGQDDEARPALEAEGAVWMALGSDGDLNDDLRAAEEAVRTTDPLARVAVLVGDLPSLQPDELRRALAAARRVARGFVADAAGTGTTLLTAGPTSRLEPRFGVRSRAAHAAGGAVPIEPGPVPGLRRDVDTEVDLWDAGRLGVGSATAEVVESA